MTLAFEIVCRLPRSKKRRIREKWLKDGANYSVLARTMTDEEIAEHEEFHRSHGEDREEFPGAPRLQAIVVTP